jgi:hypothetical protein
VPANSITVTAQSLITAAMQEIGALSPGEQASNEDAAWVLQKLQRLIDRYNAQEAMVYSVDFQVFTLNAGANPVTIGPGATFDVAQRPVSIESASLIMNNGSPTTNQVEILLNMRDDMWWAQQTIKGLTSTLPTDLYYSANWPNGNLYFWPAPTATNQVRLEMRLVLGQITSYAARFSMPPAYWDLVINELAVQIAPSFEKPVSPDLRGNYMRALKAVQVNNISSPRMGSDAPTQSSTSNSRPHWSFLTGLSD